MSFNWFDIVLLVIIGIAVIIGVIKGLIRQIVGITAVFAGLFLAMSFYAPLSSVLMNFIKNKMVADLLGFLGIFFGILILGGLVSWALHKLMKGPLKFVNHTLGAALGLIEGILICGVLVLSQMIFPIDRGALENSKLAPSCARMARTAYTLIPKDLKEQFNLTYRDIVEKNGGKDDRLPHS